MSEGISGKPRIPFPDKGLQINFCKNLNCSNFGVPASTEKQPKGPGAQKRPGRDRYKVGGIGKKLPYIECLLCGATTSLKSNMAINEELDRISSFLNADIPASCPNSECQNHVIPLKNNPKAYYKHSSTKAGSKRFRCKKCGSTFSLPAPNLYQKQPHLTLEVFRLVVSKMPIRKICKKTGISTGSFYAKLDYIHKQCLRFAGNRERKLLEGMPLADLSISVDRQEYMVNWTQRIDRRTTVLQAVGSADNKTRYIFGMHLNFDPSLEQDFVEEQVLAHGDLEVAAPFRKYARIWLKDDYEEALKKKSSVAQNKGELLFNTEATLEESEGLERHTAQTRLPLRCGVQIHSQYTLISHFHHLRRLLSGARHVTFYMDQESGIRSACISAFGERMLARTCDAFFVKINKMLNSDQLALAAKMVRRNFIEYVGAQPLLTEIQENDVKHMMMVDRIRFRKKSGARSDSWVEHPYPLKNEPEMQISYLSDMGDYSDDELARLYLNASLRGIDGFFQKIRRDMSPLERPAPSASSNRRIWYGYSLYNPAMVAKLIDIYRVFYNYIEVGKDKKTPAMRLGLAKAPIRFEDVLYYN